MTITSFRETFVRNRNRKTRQFFILQWVYHHLNHFSITLFYQNGILRVRHPLGEEFSRFLLEKRSVSRSISIVSIALFEGTKMRAIVCVSLVLFLDVSWAIRTSNDHEYAFEKGKWNVLYSGLCRLGNLRKNARFVCVMVEVFFFEDLRFFVIVLMLIWGKICLILQNCMVRKCISC